MNVTVVADVLGEENNGTSTACMNLVRYLESQGDKVNIVCADQDKNGKEGYYVVDTIHFGPFVSYLVKKNNVSLAHADKRVITEAITNADIVHIMMPFSLGVGAVKLAKKLGKPVTAGFHAQAENVTSHLMLMRSNLANNIAYKAFNKLLYSKVDGIHYPSEFIRDLFEQTIGHKTNGYVISNGVSDIFIKKEVAKPDNLKNKFVILFTGRYSKEKSHTVLVKAVGKSKYKNQIQLIFAGQGPREKEILKAVKRNKINMPIMKFFSKDELVKVINYSDLYVHPAEYEIEAISCLEAISCGLVPVIANSSKCATKAFAIDDKNLFKRNDSKDLANKIDYWIEHPKEKEQRSKEYIGFTRKFNQEECMLSMRKMMIECIEKNKTK